MRGEAVGQQVGKARVESEDASLLLAVADKYVVFIWWLLRWKPVHELSLDGYHVLGARPLERCDVD